MVWLLLSIVAIKWAKSFHFLFRFISMYSFQWSKSYSGRWTGICCYRGIAFDLHFQWFIQKLHSKAPLHVIEFIWNLIIFKIKCWGPKTEWKRVITLFWIIAINRSRNKRISIRNFRSYLIDKWSVFSRAQIKDEMIRSAK